MPAHAHSYLILLLLLVFNHLVFQTPLYGLDSHAKRFRLQACDNPEPPHLVVMMRGAL